MGTWWATVRNKSVAASLHTAAFSASFAFLACEVDLVRHPPPKYSLVRNILGTHHFIIPIIQCNLCFWLFTAFILWPYHQGPGVNKGHWSITTGSTWEMNPKKDAMTPCGTWSTMFFLGGQYWHIDDSPAPLFIVEGLGQSFRSQEIEFQLERTASMV